MHYGREWCPHTATAAEVYSRLSVAERRDQPWVLVATAHPAKFNEIVEPIIGRAVPIPDSLERLLRLPQHAVDVPPTPWVSVTVNAAHDDYRGDIRDSDRLEAGVEFGGRLGTDFDASFGVASDRRWARNDDPVVPGISGKVFDLRGQSAFARAAYDVTERLQVGGRLSVRRGDVESTTRPNLDIFLASAAIAADPTFGSDFFAYRMRGTTRTASLNASWALSDRSSLNFGYAVASTASYDDLNYLSRVGSILLAFRY